MILTGLALCAVGFTACTETERSSADPLVLDSVAMDETKYYEFTPHADDAEGVPFRVSVDVALHYLYPVGSDSLRLALNEWVLGDRYADLSPTEAAQKYLAGKYEALTDEMTQIPLPEDKSTIVQEWLHSLQTDLVADTEGYASFSSTLTTYSGGAHGMSSVSYRSFDKATGRAILESDLFVDSYQDQLGDIILQALVKHFEVADTDALESEGILFSAENLELNGNCALSEEGLIYCFNPYEIAPYSVGIITVTLPWESLRPIIRSGGIAEQYIHLDAPH